MGGNGLGACPGSPGFQQNNRFLAGDLTGYADELLAILDPLHISRNNFHFGMVAEKCDHIRFIHIQFIAQTGKMRKADRFIGNIIHHAAADRAGLGHKRN